MPMPPGCTEPRPGMGVVRARDRDCRSGAGDCRGRARLERPGGHPHVLRRPGAPRLAAQRPDRILAQRQAVPHRRGAGSAVGVPRCGCPDAAGPAARPIRALAIVYVDLFRGLPAVIVIYLIAFGLPIAGLPVLAGLSGFKLCILALVLVYGAYVSEVFRAGMESVHRSQSARRAPSGCPTSRCSLRRSPASHPPDRPAAAQRLHRAAKRHRPGQLRRAAGRVRPVPHRRKQLVQSVGGHRRGRRVRPHHHSHRTAGGPAYRSRCAPQRDGPA